MASLCSPLIPERPVGALKLQVMDGISWTDILRATFCSCTSCGVSRSHSTDDFGGDLESQSRTQPQSWSAQHQARDELEGLLASDNEEIDTMSLHSNVGRKSKKKKTKRRGGWGIAGRKKSSKPKNVQLFGWSLFGKPTQGEIALSSSEDEGDGPSASRTRVSASRPTSSTFENLSDASPLDSATIARLASSQWNSSDADFADEVQAEVQRHSPQVGLSPPKRKPASNDNAQNTLASPTSPAPDTPSSTAETTLSTEDVRATEQAKAIRRAVREQRKRLKEELARRAQEDEERRAELAAGGFGFEAPSPIRGIDDDFGSFIEGTTNYSAEGTGTFGQARATPTLTAGTSQTSSVSADDDDPDDADYGAEYAAKRRGNKHQNGAGGSGSAGTSDRSKSVSNAGKSVSASRPPSVSSQSHFAYPHRPVFPHNSTQPHPNPLIRPNMVPLPPSSIGSGPGSDGGRRGNGSIIHHQRQDSQSSVRLPTFGHSKSNSRSSYRKTHKPFGSQGSFTSLTGNLQPSAQHSARGLVPSHTSPLSQPDIEPNGGFDGVVGGFDSTELHQGFDGVPGGDFSLEDVQNAMKHHDQMFDEGFDGVPGGGFGEPMAQDHATHTPQLDSENDFPSTGLSRTTFGRATSGR